MVASSVVTLTVGITNSRTNGASFGEVCRKNLFKELTRDTGRYMKLSTVCRNFIGHIFSKLFAEKMSISHLAAVKKPTVRAFRNN